jgi:hypothetical protein
MAKLFWQLCSPVHHCVNRPSNDRSPNNSNTLKRAREYHNFGYEAKISVREQRKISESALSFHVVDASSDIALPPACHTTLSIGPKYPSQLSEVDCHVHSLTGAPWR